MWNESDYEFTQLDNTERIYKNGKKKNLEEGR